MQPTEVVAVEWDDAHGSITDEVTPMTLSAMHGPCVMVTVGWLLQLDDEGVSIANERQPDGSCRGHTFVPLGMVRSIRSLLKTPLHRRPMIYERTD